MLHLMTNQDGIYFRVFSPRNETEFDYQIVIGSMYNPQ